MAKDLITDASGNTTEQDESVESANARAERKTANEAKRYATYRTAGYLDEDTNQNTKTVYGRLGEQLDMLFKDIEAGKFGDTAKTGSWYKHIKSVKDNNPKPS